MSSESKREDGYDLAMQFDEVPQDTDEGDDPEVNVDLEPVIECSLMRCEPEQQCEQELAQASIKGKSKASILSKEGNVLHYRLTFKYTYYKQEFYFRNQVMMSLHIDRYA